MPPLPQPKPRAEPHLRLTPPVASALPTPPKRYDLTANIHSLMGELAAVVPGLSHVDAGQVFVGLSIAKSSRRSGTFACCIPLRFDGGDRTLARRGRVWEWPPMLVDGREMLYCINFTVPRFLDLTARDKLDTVVHEMCHISPRFDGSLRRFGDGRHAHHGASREWYDRVVVKPLVEEALPKLDMGRWPFLMLNRDGLRREFGSVTGQVAKKLRPRLRG